MSKAKTIEDFVGLATGAIGGLVAKYKYAAGIKFIMVSTYFPSIHDLVTPVTGAVLCAIAGFVTTRVCHYVWTEIKKAWKKFKLRD